MGRKHDRWCDCHAEKHVSGKDEKCNYRYGVKRQRAKERQQLKKELTLPFPNE